MSNEVVTSNKRFHIGVTSVETCVYVLDTGRAGMTMCRCYNEAQAREIADALERVTSETGSPQSPDSEDAARYRYIRSDACGLTLKHTLLTGTALDAALDAERRAVEKELRHV